MFYLQSQQHIDNHRKICTKNTKKNEGDTPYLVEPCIVMLSIGDHKNYSRGIAQFTAVIDESGKGGLTCNGLKMQRNEKIKIKTQYGRSNRSEAEWVDNARQKSCELELRVKRIGATERLRKNGENNLQSLK